MKRNLVYVVGLGPGDPQFLTAQAKTALENADVLCGYTVYIDLIRSFYPEKEVHATGMTKEIDRCRWALETAQSGKTVALVCSGDAGVYGMASPILELAPNYPSVEIEVIPGLTAALSGGAVLGAPLAHDFCVISLSDRLTPWEIIEKRLACAELLKLMCAKQQHVLVQAGENDLAFGKQLVKRLIGHACLFGLRLSGAAVIRNLCAHKGQRVRDHSAGNA